MYSSNTQNSLFYNTDLFRLIFENLHNGALVTDKDGYIIFFNKPYGDFLGIPPDKQIGKHCTDVINNSRMHIVGATGNPEINHVLHINGQNMIVQRIPIKRNQRVIAVFGQIKFYDVSDLGLLLEKISNLESKVAYHDKVISNVKPNISSFCEFDNIVTQSNHVNNLKAKASQLAVTDFPILIQGESGTGKDLFAQAIHSTSHRKNYPFIRINCAAIPKELVASELFGHEKGSFTGAVHSKPGKFELAHNGTIFLDEISELPLDIQGTLLSILENKYFERVGGCKSIFSDFRVLSASNKDLMNLVNNKLFREDLYYRLNAMSLNIPPLRHRKDDIILLSKSIANDFSNYYHKKFEIDKEAEKQLAQYYWPGNVRELQNFIREKFILNYTSTEKKLSKYDIYDLPTTDESNYIRISHKESNQHLCYSKDNFEKDLILQTLERHHFNKSKCARSLGISRSLLYYKIKKYNLYDSILSNNY